MVCHEQVINRKDPAVNVIRRHLPSPAMIVACASLIVALGGVSYAAGVLPTNSVGTAQLQKKAVTGAKLRNDAVTAAKVKDGTLTAAKFKAGTLPAGRQGPAGPQGPKGDTGAQGNQGVPGTTRAYGLVDEDGTLSRSKNVASVTHPQPGAYCIRLADDIDIDKTGLIATPDLANDDTSDSANGTQAFVEWWAHPSNVWCPTGTLLVTTFKRTITTSNGFVSQIRNVYAPEGFFFVVP
jgi:hypothetical protein